MSRRQSSGFTGANAIPLGTRNKAIGAKRQFTSSPPRSYDDDMPRSIGSESGNNSAAAALKAAQAAAANLAKLANLKKPDGSTWTPPAPPPNLSVQQPPSGNKNDEDRGRPRKKRSRWGIAKTEIPGMPASISNDLTPQQQKAYIVQLQIEDITRKLKSGDLGIPPNPEDRSPSPEPIYNGEGKRMNTREYRTRKRLEEERHKLIQQMQDLNPDYKPPMDYKPMLQRVSERVMIPTDVNPNINFVGLLIGPRGNTLKKIEKDSNCKIMIRGKGSVKEGKIGRKDGQPLPGEDEPLHALVSSTAVENVQKAVKEIQNIIKQGIEQPEEDNDLRKLQLMELAKLNGTLREDLMPKERAWLKPENQTITNTTICTKCGGRGHLAQDCRGPLPGETLQPPPIDGSGNVDRAKMDSEYMSLMAELGEGPPPSRGGNNGPNQSGPGRGGFNNFQTQNRFGGPRAPWMGPRGGGGNGPPRFNSGPPGQRQRFGGPRNAGPPMMNQNNGPPPPWMPPGPFGPQGAGPNQWGPPPAGMPPPPFGGFNNNANDSNKMGGDSTKGSNVPPWMAGQDGSAMMGPPPPMPPMGGMYGGDQSGGYFNQPPPPPPSSAPQPPPPPASGASGAMPWQQQWGAEKDKQDKSKSSDASSSSATSTTSTTSAAMMGGATQQPMMMGMPGMGYMGGYGNMGMWGMGAPPPPGPVPPPMPSGPGPVPPPPPGGQDGSQGGSMAGMDYSGSMGLMQGYGMPPAPPPPPPQ